jgi:hypothetical protein
MRLQPPSLRGSQIYSVSSGYDVSRIAAEEQAQAFTEVFLTVPTEQARQIIEEEQEGFIRPNVASQLEAKPVLRRQAKSWSRQIGTVSAYAPIAPGLPDELDRLPSLSGSGAAAEKYPPRLIILVCSDGKVPVDPVHLPSAAHAFSKLVRSGRIKHTERFLS